VSELKVNRKCRANNAILQLLTPYNDPKGGSGASEQKPKGINSRLQFETVNKSVLTLTTAIPIRNAHICDIYVKYMYTYMHHVCSYM